MNSHIENLVRDNVKNLIPYSSARDEFHGEDAVLLDANENPYASVEDLNRYPDPHQRNLKNELAQLKGVLPEQIFVGNGSDESIDLLYRIFCRPEVDNVITTPPTYGMYGASASINQVEVKKVPLLPGFELDVTAILKRADQNSKIIFLCSPNNPSGNNLSSLDIKQVLESFNGIAVVDEAYIDFAERKSFLTELANYPRLVVLQTFSKAWGLAGARLGMAFASKDIIGLFSRIKPPYNVNSMTQNRALEALQKVESARVNIKEIKDQRVKLNQAFDAMQCCVRVFHSDANFLLVEFEDHNKVFDYLLKKNIILRDRSREPLCSSCLRITVGTPQENELLVNAMKEYEENIIYRS